MNQNYPREDHKNGFIFCMKTLSPLLQFEELTEPEWQSLVSLLEQDYPNPIISFVVSKAGFIKRSLDDLLVNCNSAEAAAKEERRLYRIVSTVFRGIIFAMRRKNCWKEIMRITDPVFLDCVEKGMELQNDWLYQELIQITYRTFDLKFNMHFIFLAVSNTAILNAMKQSIDPKIHRDEKLQILIRLLHDSRIITQIQDMDESPEFITTLIPQIKMSTAINNLPLFRALNTVFDIHLLEWAKGPELDQYIISLQSEIIRKIRKDTALYIDIKLPQKMIIQYSPSDQSLIFQSGLNPSSKMTRGGIFLGELVKLRALNRDEIKANHGVKNLESTIIPGYGISWALRLLGASNSSFLTSLDTLWWYFRILTD
jgi:hypothetical protein